MGFLWTTVLSIVQLALCTAITTTAPIEPRANTTATAYCSSSDRKYNLSSFDAPIQGPGSPNSMATWNLTINDTPAGYRQNITGFGAAVTDATVSTFTGLTADGLSALLRTLMTSDGADFSLMRHTIGASDLTGDPSYTYNDDEAGLKGFNLGNRGRAMAGLLAKMRALKPELTILGSSWSAPGWMKLNGVLEGTTDNNNLDMQRDESLAEYFVKYIQAYAAAGAAIDAITIQNEPLNSQAGYPTMYVSADDAGAIINEAVGPALQKAGLNTEIWAYDHNTDQPSYPQSVLETASAYVPAVAWHCYAPNNDWTVLSDFHDSNPSTRQYMTECWTSPSTGWSQAADFTIGPLQNWASGALAWTLGTNAAYGPHLASGGCDTCRGLVVVGDDGGYELTIDYYMLAQFSRFMPAGAVILGGEGSWTYDDGTGLQSVATVNPDGTRTVVVLNKMEADVYVTVAMGSGGQWSGRVYRDSVVTWVLPES